MAILSSFAAVLVLAGDPASGLATLAEKDLRAHVGALAGPENEGRDSPSQGLARAARYIAERFADAGLGCAPDSTLAWKRVAGEGAALGPGPRASGDGEACTYLRPFTWRMRAPVPERCRLELLGGPGEPMRYGVDFVPIGACDGAAKGEIVFAGYGIDDSGEKYDDLAGLGLKGKIALILGGEPAHPRRFEGPELSRAASLWAKLADLGRAGAAGVLVVRRSNAGADAGTGVLDFRHTWAFFEGGDNGTPPHEPPPALEITSACASRLLGEDVEALASEIDARVKPVRSKAKDRTVSLEAASTMSEVAIDNVVGWIEGGDPALAGEVVVLGAHYDHIGVDERGRVGFGADDNASGAAVLIELAESLATSRPRRSVALCAFAAEEDGLLGSRAFCQSPPVSLDQIAAMINLDMVGRGDAGEVAILGVEQNPGFERLLKRAQKLSATGVKKLVLGQGEELFERSDHYAFHEKGIPVMFFFEGLPISRNKDYHTWRDTIELLDFEKILNTARLVHNTMWCLANDEERPPRPR